VRQLQATEHQAFLFLHREPHKKTVKTCLANSWPIFGSWLGYSLTRHLRQAESSRFGRPAVTKGAAGFHRSSSGESLCSRQTRSSRPPVLLQHVVCPLSQTSTAAQCWAGIMSSVEVLRPRIAD